MIKNSKEKVAIFTDGSSRGNPGPGGWGAVIVFSGEEEKESKVVEIGGGEKETTNNRMEMMAVIGSLEHALKHYAEENNLPSLIIYTDSSYLINGITGWVKSWERSGWRKKDGDLVKNKDLWEKLVGLVKNFSISWEHVEGHAGIVGNERADKIACMFADGEEPKLKELSFKDYGEDILSLEKRTSSVESRDKKRSTSSKRVYSYVSLVDGDVRTHKSWEECKERVKRVSGARFKKVYSRVEEKSLVREWSV